MPKIIYLDFTRVSSLQCEKMASVTRTLQAVKPHIPLIKFPTRGPRGSSGAVGNMLQSNDSSFQPNPPGQSSTRSPVADSGLETVPLKYRRKPISIEEMEYIERGGPE